MASNLSESQKKHMGEARIAADRALTWAKRAEEEGLNILVGFWKEVNSMLKIGIELQYRALQENALLQQSTKKIIETQKRGLFDGGSEKT